MLLLWNTLSEDYQSFYGTRVYDDASNNYKQMQNGPVLFIAGTYVRYILPFKSLSTMSLKYLRLI